MKGGRLISKSEAPRPELHLMRDFDLSQPAILHDRLTDRIETWTGERAAEFRERSVSRSDGTVEWDRFLFDGWGNVLGG
jgi:hypothetical protein